MSSFWTKRRKIRRQVDFYMDSITNPSSCDSNDEIAGASRNFHILKHRNKNINSLDLLTFPATNKLVEDASEGVIIKEKPLSNNKIPCLSTQLPNNFRTNLLHTKESFSSVDMLDESCELQNDLANWAIQHKVTHAATGGILNILRKWFSFLPKDPRTLLDTKTYVAVKPISGGEYCHMGIENGICQQIISSTALSRKILLQINIDGLPLFKSSNTQLWPILGMIENYKDFNESQKEGIPFIIGIFNGKNKPLNVNQYLHDFVDEARKLETVGIFINGDKFEFILSAFVCDMPARAFIKCITGHSGYSGCDRCTQHGKYINSVTFPECDAPLRTNKSFHSMDDPPHHSKIQKSPLMFLNIGMVSHFVLDYMHLVCLGVMKKLVTLWISGPLKTRIGRQSLEKISSKLLELKQFMPSEFQRKPRSLFEHDRWKATEFRQLLLYTGYVVLIDSLPKELYDNFLMLSVGIGILLNPALCLTYQNYSHDLLVSFIKHYGELFGQDKISYNVHALVHLQEDSNKYGPLDNVSAFIFENFLGKIKRSLRKPNMPLQQIIRRLSEQQTCNLRRTNLTDPLKYQHNDGPVISQSDRQYKELNLIKFKIRLSSGDRYVLLTNGEIVFVENIIKTFEGNIHLIYRKYLTIDNFFTYPLPSKQIGIFKVSNLSNLHNCQVTDVVKKYVVLPYKTCNIAIPLLHTS